MTSLRTTTSCTSTSATTYTRTTLADNETAQVNAETLGGPGHTVIEPSIAPRELLQADTAIEHLKFFHGRMNKDEANALLHLDGQYLIRFAKDKTDGILKTVISLRWNGKHYHFLIREKFGLFSVEESQFRSIDSLIQFHERMKKPLTRKSGALIAEPILRKSAHRHGQTLVPLVLKFFVVAMVAFALYGSVLMNAADDQGPAKAKKH